MALPTDGNAPLSTPSHLTEHQRISDAIAGLQPAWTALPFAANWGNYGSVFELCAYCKIGDRVFLQGLANTTATGAQTVATLPVGFRPKRQHLLVVYSINGAIRLDIETNGVLSLLSFAAAGWMQLSNIQFATTGL